MRRTGWVGWGLVALLTLAPPAPAALVAGEGARLRAERVAVVIAPDGTVRLSLEAVVQPASQGPTVVLYALPPGAQVDAGTAGFQAQPDGAPPAVVTHPWLWTTGRRWLRLRREQHEAQVAASTTPSPWPRPAAAPATAREVAADELAGLPLTPAQREALADPARAGRRLVAVACGGEGDVVRAPAINVRCPAGPATLPFWTVPDPAADPATDDQPWELQITAPDPVEPAYPDGTPLLSPLAARYAWTPPDGTAFVAHYRANVPLTARTDDLLLQPSEAAPIPPAAPRPLAEPRVVPVDWLGGEVVLVLVVVVVGWRRRTRCSSV